MDELSFPSPPVAFGSHVFDPAKRELRCSGRLVSMPRKAFDLLAILIDRRGAAVSREELYDLLWPDGAVEDGNLTQAVYLVRRALDPSGDGRSYIETLPRFGYRFARELAAPPPPVSRGRRRWTVPGLAAALALGLCVMLLGAPAAPTKPLAAEAATAYALGRFHVDMRGRENLRRSIGYFERTVHGAPSSALGYAGLASSHALLAEFERDGSARFEAEVRTAKAMQAEAVRRDRANAGAHAVAAFIAYRFDHDRAAAEREFRAAFEGDERDAMAHHWYGVFLLTRGRVDDGVAELEVAHRLEPTSEVYLRWLARGYVLQRRYADAGRAFAETLAIRPTDGAAALGAAIAAEEQHRYGDALAALDEAARLVPYEQRYAIPARARIMVRTGRLRPDAAQRARLARRVTTGQIDGAETALLFLAAGDRPRAVTALRYAVRRSEVDRALIRLDPRFAALRDDARFRALVAPAWKTL
jgi:DNA-binding winged helix-turn-helix (wHTH) protein/Tfp pilus assembly protein PilF